MKPGTQTAALTRAQPSEPAPGLLVIQFPGARARAGGSKGQPQAGRRSLLWAALEMGSKAVAGIGLALLTMVLIAGRIYDLPMVPSPVFGEAHEPGRPFRQAIEGDGSGVWTANGIRRASLPAADSKSRLLILGDSYTEAVQVADADHFAHRLEQRLNGVPVLAVGRPGYSVADYIAGATTFKNLFRPDRVIIQVGAGDFQADAWTRKEGGYAYFAWQGQQGSARNNPSSAYGALALRSMPVTQPGLLSSLVRDKCPFFFPLVTFAYLRRSELKAWVEDQRQPWFRAAPIRPGEDGGQTQELGNYPLEEEMKQLAEAYEGGLTLLYLPRFDPQNPSQETEVERVLRGLATKHGVNFVSLRTKFADLAAAGRAPYGFANTRFNWGHWNRYGHQAAAELLFQECQRTETAR